MHKSRVVLGCMALVLTLVLLIPLVGCGGGGTGTTATPTGTSTGATTTPTKTPTATKTPTSTSTSGKTLSDIFGAGKSIGDVKFDAVTTSPGMPQSIANAYWKNAWIENKMKFRYEMSQDGSTSIYLVDYGTQIAYMWTQGENIAYKMDMSQAPSNPTENGDQIHPTYLGTATIDGNVCDIYQWTDQGVTEKMWIWKAKSFPVRMESTTSSGTTTIEYKNIVFGTLSDSLFQLPAGVTVTQFPSYSPGSALPTPITTPAAGSAAGPPLLQLISSSWDQEGAYAVATGEVTNITGDQIWNVTAVASYYNAGGQLITSDWALIDADPIGAGETASFTIYSTYDPTIDHVSVSFEYEGNNSKPISFTQ